MLALRRSPAARRLLQSQCRRNSTSTTPPPPQHVAHSHHSDHDHYKDGAPVHPNETFGKGFYLAIAGLVGTFALYKLDTSSKDGGLVTRLIRKYEVRNEVWEARNKLHTDMIEQAAADRSLFQDTKVRQTVNLKYPEVFNVGSPHNLETGWSGGDLTAVRAHLEAQRERK